MQRPAQRAVAPRRLVIAATLAVGLAAQIAQADPPDVRFAIAGRETFVGAPITIEITVENGDRIDPPEVPEMDWADYIIQGPSHSSIQSLTPRGFTRTVRDTYVVQIIPKSPGRHTIPSISIRVDGRSVESKPTKVTIRKSDNQGLLFIKVKSDKESVYVGQPVELTLEIWIKPFRKGRVRLDENSMWQCIDTARSTLGLFEEVFDPRNVRVRQESRVHPDGRQDTYFIYEITRRLWPERPGPLNVVDLNIIVNYPTRASRSPFRLLGPEYNVTAARPIAASVSRSPLIVKAPPEQGRPAVYRGAVGQYTMRVTASPTDVAVGDPITLTIELRGSGRLELLQPPPLSELADLNADFRVPDEPLAGVVENGTKTFTQAIRAKSDRVSSIPPIPFAYFDPESEQYVVINSDPIPIHVRESARAAVAQIANNPDRQGEPIALRTRVSGIWANYEDPDLLLVNQSVLPGWRLWTFVGSMPVAYLICLVGFKQRQRLAADPALARRRGAKRGALSRIRLAAADDPQAAAQAAMDALIGYVADRCNLPAGLTRPDAVAALRSRNIDNDLVEAVNRLLAECESARYAGSALSDSRDWSQSAVRLIDRLERERF